MLSLALVAEWLLVGRLLFLRVSIWDPTTLISSSVSCGEPTFDMARAWKVEFLGVTELAVRLGFSLEAGSTDELLEAMWVLNCLSGYMIFIWWLSIGLSLFGKATLPRWSCT